MCYLMFIEYIKNLFYLSLHVCIHTHVCDKYKWFILFYYVSVTVTNPVCGIPPDSHQRSPLHHIDSHTTQHAGLHFPSLPDWPPYTADCLITLTWELSHNHYHPIHTLYKPWTLSPSLPSIVCIYLSPSDSNLTSHSVFLKLSLEPFIVCFICVLILAWFLSSRLSAACPWIYCLFGLTLVLPFRTLFAPCLDYCSRCGLPLLSSPLDTVCCCLTLPVFWPCFTNSLHLDPHVSRLVCLVTVTFFSFFSIYIYTS